MIEHVLNVASFLFFVSNIPQIYRALKYRAGLHGSIVHNVTHGVANLLIVFVGLLTGAWGAVLFESFLAFGCFFQAYWLLRGLSYGRNGNRSQAT